MFTSFSKPNRPPLIAIFLISSLSLSYEVLLTRILSIIQWHHFAYMIISIALLGYGASGAFITIFQNKLKPRFPLVFITNILLFALSSILGLLLLQQLPFNPLELFWDNSQWIWLFIFYTLLMLPFFFAANCIGLVLYQYPGQISASYAADLLGAALGALAIVFLLHWFFPLQTLQLIVLTSGLAALIAALELKSNKTIILICFLIMLFPWLLPKAWMELKPSEYKSLSQTRNIIGTQVINKKSGPLGLLTVLESPKVPFRHAPGLSLGSDSLPPEQLGIFYDGDSMSAITRFDGNLSSLAYLSNMTSSLPYHLLENPEVLILGAGGGADILQAKYFQAKQIDAVEINQQIVNLIKNDYANFSGNIYNSNNVNVHIAESRAYLQASEKKYDLIQMALMDSFATSAAGLHALNESYLYTTQAMKLYLKHLNTNGVLALTRWVKLPPRDTLKLVDTAKQALHQLGITDPKQHIALIRSWNTATLLIKNQPFISSDIEKITNFSRKHSFDLAYYPGITKMDINLYNVLPEAYFFQGTSALLSEKNRQFISQYKYDLQAATDDKPYFFNFLKSHFLAEILQLPANQGLALIEWGTVILYATLIQACLASVFFILLPLWIYQRRQPVTSQPKMNTFVFSYFTLLGIAFMFIEIAFIQRFILFLGHPTYAIAVVLSGFLFFAGIGSAFSKKWPAIQTIKTAIIGIVLCAILYLLILPSLFNWCINLPEIIKIIISLLLILPMAFFMGMPFPQGLSLLAQYSPSRIPWAWGVNGCASVISAIAAILLAMKLGFTWVVLLALVCYTLTGKIFTKKIQSLFKSEDGIS